MYDGERRDDVMTDATQKKDSSLIQKYTALVSLISGIQGRMLLSEIVYLTLNVIILFFIVGLMSFLLVKGGYLLGAVDISFLFFCIIVGMAISTYWVASSMRLQMKLKLHYFQIRYIERKMNREGEFFFSDESRFFDPEIDVLESPDNREVLHYAGSGLERMDGFVGASKPRHFSWFMPCLFILIYWIIFFLVTIHT
jgi:hypothetical protein